MQDPPSRMPPSLPPGHQRILDRFPQVKISPMSDLLQAPERVEMDRLGEMPIHHGANRPTDMPRCKGNHFYRILLASWWYTEERCSVPILEEEKETILETFVHYGRTHLGSNIHVVDG